MSSKARSVGLGKQRELPEREKDLDDTEVAPPSVATERSNRDEADCDRKKDLMAKCLALLMRGWAQQPLPLITKVLTHFLSL